MFKTTTQHQNYWKNREIDWKKAYLETWTHPHRQLIINELKKLKFQSVFEVGCGAGANLLLIKKFFPKAEVGGVDINKDAIETAKIYVDAQVLETSPATDVFMNDKSADVVITDACLIYLGLTKINKAIEEIKRVARNNIVLCEFHSENPLERLGVRLGTGYNVYNYKQLLNRHGFYDVQVQKIPKEAWEGSPWEKLGYIITAHV